MNKVYNFSPGPSMLPLEVIKYARRELFNWNNFGISLMEINHRNIGFLDIVTEFEENIRYLLKIPENYTIICCQGGARGQFSAIPLNLFRISETVEYINSGYWSEYAAYEASKYCIVKKLNIKLKKDGYLLLRPMNKWLLQKNIKYLHYCSNETVEGIAINSLPNFSDDKIIIADCTSDILSKPLDLNCFGVIYASSQKNIGTSGLTLVIIRSDLLGQARKTTPSILNYTILCKFKSVYNTPVIFSWYLSGLVLKWLKKQGGLEVIQSINQEKANLLYNFIDNSEFYTNNIYPINRSIMNVTFKIKKNHLQKQFIYEAEKNGLLFLKGHKSVGGFRASIYNAMPIAGIYKLIKFMKQFELNNR